MAMAWGKVGRDRDYGRGEQARESLAVFGDPNFCPNPNFAAVNPNNSMLSESKSVRVKAWGLSQGSTLASAVLSNSQPLKRFLEFFERRKSF